MVRVFLTANRYSSGPFAPELVSVNVTSCVASLVKSPGRALDGHSWLVDSLRQQTKHEFHLH